MNKLKTLALSLILMFSVNQLFAHALFIRTAANGKKGTAQEVKIFYGEPGENAPEKLADWWSDTKEFSLWLINPKGEKEQLKVTPAADHFVASFTPATDGVYTLSISHIVKEIAGKTQYQFNAAALVSVGKADTGNSALANKAELGIFVDALAALKKGKEITLSSHFKAQPAAGVAISVFAPAGWVKQIKTRADGKTTFNPEWSGSYLLEAGHNEKVTGQAFESIERIATLSITVN
ncbi:DUF4198 domain-containing protein [Pedobacter steynii]|uniref:Nickel transport protein n=1 Tax=Pedobacter steynii TaxID=430522 RepID=A0A1D7QC50_9SPHI|nr:DUF4198 domain-containing protein [Pedobacter steynii]AOM76261.1 hypothetical protein BFS30_03265 [Pedobacter steynii]